MKHDYVVVGSGLTGAVIARLLWDAGRDVVILERRTHLGGNVHDHVHPSGIRIHTYGPHYFRTSSDAIWEFATRFSPFYKYEAIVQSLVDERLENWPIAASYIQRTVGHSWKPEFKQTPANFQEAALSLMPRVVYEKFVKEYNEKQWGVSPTSLGTDLCKRFDVRADDEPRLTPHARYQGLPETGYATWMEKMVQDIPRKQNFDYLKRRDEIQVAKHLVFTGPIDEFFGFKLGRLQYRGQIRSHQYHNEPSFCQPCGQINNPQHAGGQHIRTLEWKHMMPKAFAESVKGTVLTTETAYTPNNPDQYEYPFPSQENAALYSRYKALATSLDRILICGRLGEYRYYDMDQAIGRAMVLARQILGINGGH